LECDGDAGSLAHAAVILTTKETKEQSRVDLRVNRNSDQVDNGLGGTVTVSGRPRCGGKGAETHTKVKRNVKCTEGEAT
jgi:hypothetical protein